MTDTAPDAQPETAPDKAPHRGDVRYTERLSVPWWGWPLPLFAAGLLAAEIHMGYPGLRAWLPYALLLPATAVLIAGMGRTRVRVVDDELWVGDAHLPLRFVGTVTVIRPPEKRIALGPKLDPTAFLMHRGWIAPVVRIDLTDPDDPTPYWMVSTRRPEQLVAALGADGGQHDSRTP